MTSDTNQLNSCKNCQTQLTSKYCSNCGQAASLNKRINFYSFLIQLFNILTDWDKGIIRTVIDLAICPGLMVKGYLSGQRTKYVSPFRLLLIPILVFTISIQWFKITPGNEFVFFLGILGLILVSILIGNLAQSNLPNQWISSLKLDQIGKNISIKPGELANILSENLAYELIVISLVASGFLFLLFRKKYNFAELVTFHIFLLSFYFSVGVIFVVFPIRTEFLILPFFCHYAFGVKQFTDIGIFKSISISLGLFISILSLLIIEAGLIVLSGPFGK
jgi:hypothetical protein